MSPVIKPDGTIVEIELAPRRGRPPKYPWAYMEVGDHFEAPWEARESLGTKIAALRRTGREPGSWSGFRPGTCRVFRARDCIV